MSKADCKHEEEYLEVVVPSWSYVCRKCQRYNADGRWYSQEESFNRLLTQLRLNRKSSAVKQFVDK